MRTGRLRGALLATAALAAVSLVAGCVPSSPRSLVRLTAAPASAASASPEPTVVFDDVVVPSGAGTPELAAVLAPSSADATGGIPVSDAGVGVAGEGDVVVDVYFDLMCPGCGNFERKQGDQIVELLDPETGADDVTVVYHPVSIMDRVSEGTHYPSRAANAVSVVADQDPEHFQPFVVALFADQPAEGTKGLTDDEIARLAQDVGVPASVTDQFTATADFEGTALRTFVPWTAAVTATLPVNPGVGQPTVPAILVNGERWDGWPTEPLSDKVAAARSAAGGEG